MTLCIMCKKPIDQVPPWSRAFCETCWETEQALTDEAIARAAKVLQNLASKSHLEPERRSLR